MKITNVIKVLIICLEIDWESVSLVNSKAKFLNESLVNLPTVKGFGGSAISFKHYCLWSWKFLLQAGGGGPF